MGVKDLWNILAPLCERRPLFELEGKTIAIDLSCWIVDSQTATDHVVQPKMYLRNLYFRTAFLLMHGIWPVFVLEGKAPTLKHKTIAKRNDIRAGFRERKTQNKGGRRQFNRVLAECQKMLQYMGLTCVQGEGEAEATCAYLNADGIVDGCISQDSDCFLYGARVVYRNFCTSAQGNRGGTGGSVDIYSMDKIERAFNLGRNKMIALALLCGCDYDEGLSGVGKEAALKLFKMVDDEHVLDRLKNWRTDTELEKMEWEFTHSNVCTSCGHKGKMQKHAKSGCVDCGTTVKCSESYKEKRALILNEVALRKKALQIEDFPNQELIDEFLLRKNVICSKVDLQWKRPQVAEFINFVEQQLCWEPQYAFEKIFPLATRWQILHLPNISLETRMLIPDLFIPEKIKKIRNIRSVASYEIIWKNNHSIVEKLKAYHSANKENDDNIDDILNELTTIEPQNITLKCYPEIVEEFENLRNAKTKKKSVKPRAKKTVQDNEQPTDPTDGIKVKNRKKKRHSTNNKKLDNFIMVNRPLSLEESFERLSITPKRSKQEEKSEKINICETDIQSESHTNMNVKLKRGPQFEKVLATEKKKLNNTLERMFNELSPDDFISENEENDLNVSDIIEDICSKKIFRFKFADADVVTEQQSIEKIDGEEILEENCLVENTENETPENNTSIDEFGDIEEAYIPINQRIQRQTSKRISLLLSAEVNNRFSLGFDDLINSTTDESINC